MFDLFYLLEWLFWPVVVIVGIVMLVRFLGKKPDNGSDTRTQTHDDSGWLMFGLLVLTIAVAEEVVDLFFLQNGPTKVIAKLVIDTALVSSGLLIHHKVVGKALLYAGLVRFVIIFFQMQGMDPTLRFFAILVIVIGLLYVGAKKFGKDDSKKNQSISSTPKEDK